MNKFFLTLAVLLMALTSAPALAQDPGLLAQCAEMFGLGGSSPSQMWLQLCKDTVEIDHLRARMERGEQIDLETLSRLQELEAKQAQTLRLLEEGRTADREIQSQLALILAAIKAREEAEASSSASPTIPAESTQTPRVAQTRSTAIQQTAVGGQPVTYGGARHRKVVAPHLVSTYSDGVPDGNRLHLSSMNRGAARWAPGGQQVRVVVVNNGQPCQPDLIPGPASQTWCNVVVPEGVNPMLSGFSVGYVDMNKDGTVDSTPVLIMDAKAGQDLYLSWRSTDNIQLVWLVESGEYEEVEVQPGVWTRVPVWHPYPQDGKGRSVFGANKKGGRQIAPGSNGSAVYGS